MEIIRKTLNLETSKSRFNGKLPAYANNLKPNESVDCSSEQYTDWNKSPVNIVIPKSSPLYQIADQIPLVRDMSNNLVLRFRTMIEKFCFLKDFANSSTFYKLCKHSENISWRKVDIEFFNDWDGKYFSIELPDVSNYKIGDIICINKDIDIYSSTFRIKDNTHRFDVDFYTFVLQLKQYGTKAYSEPFMNLPVYLEEEIIDNGVLTPYSDMWVAGKKYYLGEYVFHSENGTGSDIYSYRLIKGGKNEDGNLLYDKVRATGNIYDIVKNEYDTRNTVGISKHYKFITTIDDISDSLYDKENGNIIRKQILVSNEEDTPIFDFINVYYTGYVNKSTKLTEFDNSNSDYWEFVESFIDSPGDYEKLIVHGVCESKLNIFESKRKSYDQNGKTLPFVFDETSEPDADGKYNAQIIYSKGLVITSDGQYCYLEDPVINKEESKITFTYYIGCEVEIKNGNGNIITQQINGTGIKYVETFSYQYREYETYRQDKGIYITIKYMYIDLTTGKYADNYDINNLGGKIRVADISFKSDSLSNEVYLKTFLYKDEATSHLISVNKDIDAAIERGDYSAFERHNLLGEIKTFSDLKKYRNNYFKL